MNHKQRQIACELTPSASKLNRSTTVANAPTADADIQSKFSARPIPSGPLPNVIVTPDEIPLRLIILRGESSNPAAPAKPPTEGTGAVGLAGSSGRWKVTTVITRNLSERPRKHTQLEDCLCTYASAAARHSLRPLSPIHHSSDVSDSVACHHAVRSPSSLPPQ